MSSKLVAFRLPEELIAAVDAQAKATGQDRTAVVVQSLKQVFGAQTPEPNTVAELQDQITEVTRKVARLTEQLATLTQETRSNSRIIQRITTLELERTSTS